MVSARVAFNIPVWYKTKQNNRLIETQAMVTANRKAYLNIRKNLFFDIARLISEINSTRELHQYLLEGIIPLAKQALDSAIANYQVGKTDLIAVLNSLLELFNYENDSVMHIAEHEKSLARLEQVVGVELVKGEK